MLPVHVQGQGIDGCGAQAQWKDMLIAGRFKMCVAREWRGINACAMAWFWTRAWGASAGMTAMFQIMAHGPMSKNSILDGLRY